VCSGTSENGSPQSEKEGVESLSFHKKKTLGVHGKACGLSRSDQEKTKMCGVQTKWRGERDWRQKKPLSLAGPEGLTQITIKKGKSIQNIQMGAHGGGPPGGTTIPQLRGSCKALPPQSTEKKKKKNGQATLRPGGAATQRFLGREKDSRTKKLKLPPRTISTGRPKRQYAKIRA